MTKPKRKTLYICTSRTCYGFDASKYEDQDLADWFRKYDVDRFNWVTYSGIKKYVPYKKYVECPKTKSKDCNCMWCIPTEYEAKLCRYYSRGIHPINGEFVGRPSSVFDYFTLAGIDRLIIDLNTFHSVFNPPV